MNSSPEWIGRIDVNLKVLCTGVFFSRSVKYSLKIEQCAIKWRDGIAISK